MKESKIGFSLIEVFAISIVNRYLETLDKTNYTVNQYNS